MTDIYTIHKMSSIKPYKKVCPSNLHSLSDSILLKYFPLLQLVNASSSITLAT